MLLSYATHENPKQLPLKQRTMCFRHYSNELSVFVTIPTNYLFPLLFQRTIVSIAMKIYLCGFSDDHRGHFLFFQNFKLFFHEKFNFNLFVANFHGNFEPYVVVCHSFCWTNFFKQNSYRKPSPFYSLPHNHKITNFFNKTSLLLVNDPHNQESYPSITLC